MNGSDTSEIPENNNSNTSGESGGGAFGWYKPKEDSTTPPPIEPDPNYSHENADQPPATDQEARFRAAAIKCSEMEDELSSLMTNKLGDQKSLHLRKGVTLYKTTNMLHVSSDEDHILDIKEGREKGSVNIDYADFGDVDTNFEDQFGIYAARVLTLDIHADITTQDAYTQTINLDPKLITSNTIFFFTPNGEYKKFLRVDKRAPIDFKKRPYSSNAGSNFFLSEMTAEDFELAGQALSLLKKRVENPNWDVEEDSTVPLTK